MVQELSLRISVQALNRNANLSHYIEQELSVSPEEIQGYRILRKSVDARKSTIYWVYRLEVFIGEPVPEHTFHIRYPVVHDAPNIHIIGSGPAGLFAALRAIELGMKPIVLERGKNVRERRRDLQSINQKEIVNPESNYCFGEGGAGTYSDGKLYTRSTKRGDVRRILERLVYHGANDDILYEAHPHIGTNKLPKIIERIRETILASGGEIHFDSQLTDIIIENKEVKAIEINRQKIIPCHKLLLATGHSARDIFELLHKKNIAIQAKSFAMGIRIEHPQELIDSIQYHCKGPRDTSLPAASYSLVHRVNNRGVYSFCMCPGGFVVPSATEQKEVVVNGMSPSKRNSYFANSGMVVEINVMEDLKKYDSFGPLKALEFQKDLEKLAWTLGGKTQHAPAQRMTDFIQGKNSNGLNSTSYQPGLTETPLHSTLPKLIGGRLRKGLKYFGDKMHGYLTEQANIIGVESRTSSPVSIPRIPETLEHSEIKGLFPCGEGAGYAGGIVSAAIDGEKVAQAIYEQLNIKKP